MTTSNVDTTVPATTTADTSPKERPHWQRGLTPWKPGQSGNPSGRNRSVTPETAAHLVRQHTHNGLDLIRALLRVLRDPKARHSDTVQAANILMNRLWGQAPASLELSGPGGAPLGSQPNGLAALSVEELRQMLAQREELLALLRRGIQSTGLPPGTMEQLPAADTVAPERQEPSPDTLMA